MIGKLCDRGTKEDRVFARPYHGFPAQQCRSAMVDDVRNYRETRLDRDDTLGAMSDDLGADVVRIIPEKISDLFVG